MPPKHRDVSPFFQMFRDFLLGRKHVTNNRYADTVSPRTQPPPSVPSKSGLRVFGFPYYERDARNDVLPPTDLIDELRRKAAANAKKAQAAEAAKNAAKAGAGEPPKATETKKDDEATKDCKTKQQKDTGKKLPTPGKLHFWD